MEIDAAPLPRLRLAIREGGLAGPADREAEPSLHVRIKPDAPAAWLRGEDHFLRSIEVTGNARLAEAVVLLARNLRWDYEEDLSRIFGDVLAHRLAEGARGFAAWQADSARRLGDALAEYATEEKNLLVRREEVLAAGRELAELRDAIERLEQKVRRLE